MRPRKEKGLIQGHPESQGAEPGLESRALVQNKVHPRQAQGNVLLELQVEGWEVLDHPWNLVDMQELGDAYNVCAKCSYVLFQLIRVTTV